ncbi:recombinase family protein [Tepidibacter sp. Z1-5]|uniref:recombinase family protein n=1 Tax=Tepidibacter sp. Z1-5 TaxID=3134138 RepID=UPI0030BBAC92
MIVSELDNYQRKIYDVAIYCRLSTEDNESIESNSITNQRNLLTKYVLDQGWNIYDVYIDDGYSGLNFDRPGFKRMIKDIEEEKISLVITKDMSRLGRDYILVGFYIEKFFPENKIRFIALNDNIDNEKDNGINDITPFKAIINDMYSKDISKKVKSVFDAKKAEGKYIGSYAPFGYEKDPLDKNHLIVDKEAAVIVRRIYDMYLKGHGLTAIGRKLNSEGVETPTQYKKRKYGKYTNGRLKIEKWSHSTIKSILNNPTYMGSVAQNKYKKVNYKSKKLKKVDREDWIVVDNMHEPIISKEEFLQVKQLREIKNNKPTPKKSVRLFSSFVFCGDCGTYMTYTKNRSGIEYLICSGYKRFGINHCSRHAIMEEKLEDMILQDLRKLIKKFSDKERLEQKAKKIVENRKDSNKVYEEELVCIKKKLEEIKNTSITLYKDKARGILPEEQFLEFNEAFNKEKTSLNDRYNELVKKLKINDQEKVQSKHIMKLVDSIVNIKRLNRVILSQLIEKIEIFEDEDIKIHYNFKDPTK